jgi:hypothetical protein
MNRHPSILPVAALAVGVAILCGLPAPRSAEPAASEEDLRERAVSLYAEGRYSEALPLLEQLDSRGAATGSLLYRLAYCQRAADREADGAETQRRALEALEQEVAGAEDLEVPFYLSNAYGNVQREADARRVAAETTSRVESGDIPEPETGVAKFQLGKLYEDQDLEDPAARWYSAAVDRLTEGGRAGGAYVRRASRYVAERAFRQGDYDTARRYFTALADAGGATAADFNRLAVSQARSGDYAGAADSWQRAAVADPAQANRANYARGAARLAEKVKEMPAVAPSEKAWTDLTREELETLMKEQAARAKEIQDEVAQAGLIEKSRRKQYRRQLNEVRAVFAPAALEYALRGHSLRETAFFGGYAPLILNRAAWRLPRPDKEAGPGDVPPAPE